MMSASCFSSRSFDGIAASVLRLLQNTLGSAK